MLDALGSNDLIGHLKGKAVLARNYAIYQQHAFWAATRREPFPLDSTSDFVTSVASYPARIHLVPAVFESVARQTLMPKRAFLVLSEEEFPKRRVPHGIDKLTDLGVEVIWTQNNPYPVKMLVPIHDMNLGVGTVTLGDDMIYSPSMLGNVIRDDLKEFPRVVGQIGGQLFRRGARLSLFYRGKKADLDSPSSVVYLQGCGTYYSPGSLHASFTNMDAIRRIVPGRGSDIWFWAAAVAAGSVQICVGANQRSSGTRPWTPIPETNRTAPRDRPGKAVLEQRFQMTIDYFGIREKLLAELPDHGEEGQIPV